MNSRSIDDNSATTLAGKVSVVVPTYNEKENIAELLGLIGRHLEGTADYEVIVVDDDSPDGTADVVAKETERNSRIRLMHKGYCRNNAERG